MANIVSPQAVNFCNQKARTIADLISALDRTIPQFLLDVVRDFENVTGGNVDGDVIVDGSASDGRTQRTKLNVAELKFVAEQIKATIDVDNRRALVNGWRVNGEPIF